MANNAAPTKRGVFLHTDVRGPGGGVGRARAGRYLGISLRDASRLLGEEAQIRAMGAGHSLHTEAK